MNFAYMADALQDYDGSVKTGSTFERMFDGQNPYYKMWRRIADSCMIE